MKTISLWLSGALAIAALAAPSPVYHLWFTTPMAVSTLELPAGPYSVSRDRTGATFKNLSTGTFYIVRAKTEHPDEKNSSMKMRVATVKGVPTLEMLALPGQATDLAFGS